MMKKIKIFLGSLIVVALFATSNVYAAKGDVKIEAKPGHSTKYGYNTQTQTVENTCVGGTIDLYCIDKGKAKVANLNKCTITEASSAYQGAAAAGLSAHDDLEFMYRVINYKLGTNKTSISQVSNYTQYLSGAALNYANSVSGGGNRNNGSNSKFSHTKIDDTTVKVTANLGVAGLNRSNFSITGGTIESVSGNGTYEIIVKVAAGKSCDSGNEVTLKVKNASTSSSTTSHVFHAECPGAQNYIFVLNGSCSITDVVDSSFNDEYTFSAAGSCCPGTTSFGGECADGTTSDDLSHAKSCIEKGGFQSYCGNSVKKTADETGETITTSRHDSSIVSATMGSNPYCSVYCLEEVQYEMPGLLKAKDGAYFRVAKGYDFQNDKNKDDSAFAGKGAKINGTRKCYSSAVKTQTYIDNVIADQRAIVNDLNEYNKQKAIEKYNSNLSCEAKETSNNDGSPASCKKYKNGICTEYNNDAIADTTCKYNKCTANKVEYKTYTVTYTGLGEVASIVENINYYSKDVVEDLNNCTAGSGITENKRDIPSPSDNSDSLMTVLDKHIKQYKMCFEFKNNYCFNPKLEFSYDEPYNEKMQGELKQTKNTASGVTSRYMTSVGEDYSGSGSGSFAQRTYIYAQSGEFKKAETQTSPHIDLTSKYIAKEMTVNTEFDTGTKDVYTLHPYGTIYTGDELPSSCSGQNCYKLGKVMPVALQHRNATGVYNYYISITNIGTTGNDSCADEGARKSFTGKRLMGENCSLYESVSNTDSSNYTCQYETQSCPGCKIECICPPNNPNCYVEEKICKYRIDEDECPDCKITCVGCLWNNGDTTVAYKQISLTNMFPNQDTKNNGYNWNTTDSIDINDKAENTIKDIEKNAEKTYDKTPMYSYTLTPTVMGQIRQYNKDANGACDSGSCDTGKFWHSYSVKSGGYSNDTLRCRQGIKCESDFLKALETFARNDGTKCWNTYDETQKKWNCVRN